MATVASVKIKLDTAKLKSIQTEAMARTLKLTGAIAEEARDRVPVDTGNLQSSIRIRAQGNNEVWIIAGGTMPTYSVPYALKQEYKHKSKSGYMRKSQTSVMSGDWLKEYYGGLL